MKIIMISYIIRATDFDTEDTIVALVPTSGTLGIPKTSALSHKNLAVAGPYMW